MQCRGSHAMQMLAKVKKPERFCYCILGKVHTVSDYPGTIRPQERHASYMKRPCEWRHFGYGYSVSVPQISLPTWCYLEQRYTPVTLAQITGSLSSKQDNSCFKSLSIGVGGQAAIDNQRTRLFSDRLVRKMSKLTRHQYPNWPTMYL